MTAATSRSCGSATLAGLRAWLPLAIAATVLAAGMIASPPVQAEGPLQFNRDVRPILSRNCFACHGIDAKHREAELRLDTREGAYADRDGARAVVPGKSAASQLWQRISSTDKNEMMPPPSSHKKLSDEEKLLLKRWIEEGAPYQMHWAFEPLARQQPPATDGDETTIRNPIDAFILLRLRPEGLSMSPEADKETLIRRVAFALTGLPPRTTEVDAFLADKAAGAYEHMVDRYLASVHFGEEMARHWLDVARYADTHGLHLDNERQMWAYRDWVIRAFNANLPFDQFTVAQIAGDQLPDPTQDQLIATGFNRCNITTGEGGAIDAEYRFRYAVDRTSTVVQAWMGLTAGCAVCHDHKFDPISQKEFYSLYAFFNSAADPAMDGNALLTQPVMKIETPQLRTQRTALLEKIAEKRRQLEVKAARVQYTDPATDSQHSFRAWWKRAQGKDTPGMAPDLNEIAKRGPAKDVSGDDERRLRAYYLHSVCIDTKPQFAATLEEITKLERDSAALDKEAPSTFIFKDLPNPRDSFVMLRGAYDKPGEKVQPDVPAFLPPLKKADAKARPTRLDLARWIVASENPLTARVTVNRLWQQFLGTGLVKASHDFGTQGDVPSHPELLDWLAVEFRDSGWNVKNLVRMMLLSATFRQSARVTPALWAKDPENRLYARGPRFRLDAEQIRDNALAVSGLIQLEMGGKGAKPYQPANIWEPVGFVGSNTRFYKQDGGPALYRRSIYTFIKRTAPPPFMANFDAPNREQFCSRRERSNTPLQALELMNDVQHVEAARALAERMMTAGGATPADRIAFAYRTILSRGPDADETALTKAQFDRHLSRYRLDAAAAGKLITQGQSKPRAGLDPAELAAYTLVANTILNLDETLTRN